MKLKRLMIAIASAFGLTVAAGAHSADQKEQARNTAATSAAPAGDQARQRQARQDVRMSRLIGMKVHDAKGENLGDINDVVVDLGTGKVQYAVIGFGGFLGLGEKLHAFPIDAFKVSQESQRNAPVMRGVDNDGARGDRGTIGSDRAPARTAGNPVDNDGVRGDKGPVGTDRVANARDANRPTTADDRAALGDRSRDLHLVLNVDKERLKDAPGFDKNRWPDWNDATFRGNVDRFSGGDRAGAPANANMQLVRASKLLDAEVRDAQKRDVGNIEDMVVDLRTGKLHYALVEFDRSWNFDDKLVAVPMKALRRVGEKDEVDLMVSGDRSRFERAPAFAKREWPDLNAGQYLNDLDRWLSSWDADVGPATAPAAGTGTAAAAGSAPASDVKR